MEQLEVVESFLGRPLDGGPYPYVWLDGLTQKVREGGRIVNVANPKGSVPTTVGPWLTPWRGCRWPLRQLRHARPTWRVATSSPSAHHLPATWPRSTAN